MAVRSLADLANERTCCFFGTDGRQDLTKPLGVVPVLRHEDEARVEDRRVPEGLS